MQREVTRQRIRDKATTEWWDDVNSAVAILNAEPLRRIKQ
jgi:hypothetical protein